MGEPPFMLAFSVWLAIKDAISAVADHQIAHVYVHKGRTEETVAALYNLPCVERIISTRNDIATLGLDHPRSG